MRFHHAWTITTKMRTVRQLVHGSLLVLLVLTSLSIYHAVLTTHRIPVQNDHGQEQLPPLTCQSDFDESRQVIQDISVAPIVDANAPKALCFLMTHSGSHATKVQSVMDTWGRKCNGWIVASNQTNVELHAVRMQTPATYEHLWNKLNETLHYIYEKYYADYDWFFKVDDDVRSWRATTLKLRLCIAY
jgi:hypothetical protein